MDLKLPLYFLSTKHFLSQVFWEFWRMHMQSLPGPLPWMGPGTRLVGMQTTNYVKCEWCTFSLHYRLPEMCFYSILEYFVQYGRRHVSIYDICRSVRFFTRDNSQHGSLASPFPQGEQGSGVVSSLHMHGGYNFFLHQQNGAQLIFLDYSNWCNYSARKN